MKGYYQIAEMQRYGSLGLAAAHNFGEDSKLEEIRLKRTATREREHGPAMYAIYGRKNRNEPIEEFTLRDSCRIDELSRRLEDDATKPLPEEVRIIRTEKDRNIVGIFFK